MLSKHPAYSLNFSDSNVHVANIGPTWALSAPGGPHLGPMNITIMEFLFSSL